MTPDSNGAPENFGPSRLTFAILVVVLLVAGAAIGAVLYALFSQNFPSLDPAVRAAAIAVLGTSTAGAVALVAAYWGATTAANGARSAAQTSARAVERQGAQSRDESARQAVVALKRELVRRIAVQADRHAQEIANQFSRWQEVQGTDIRPEPAVGKTEAIEDAVNELYVLGAQTTADRGYRLLETLYNLDRYCFDATRNVDESGAVDRVPQSVADDHDTWQLVEKIVKTEMMQAHQIDVGVPPLPSEGSIGDDYLKPIFVEAQRRVMKKASGQAPEHEATRE